MKNLKSEVIQKAVDRIQGFIDAFKTHIEVERIFERESNDE